MSKQATVSCGNDSALPPKQRPAFRLPQAVGAAALATAAWFAWWLSANHFAAGGQVAPVPLPSWIVAGISGFVALFKRPGLEYDPFMQNVLRLPVWIALWVWLVAEAVGLRRRILAQTTPATMVTPTEPA